MFPEGFSKLSRQELLSFAASTGLHKGNYSNLYAFMRTVNLFSPVKCLVFLLHGKTNTVNGQNKPISTAK